MIRIDGQERAGGEAAKEQSQSTTTRKGGILKLIRETICTFRSRTGVRAGEDHNPLCSHQD